MAIPAVSRWASVRLPVLHAIPQAPLRSRTAGFPRSGSDLGFPSWVFPDTRQSLSTDIHTPCPRWFTHELAPRFECSLIPGSVSEGCTGAAKCPEPLCCTSVLPSCRRRLVPPRRKLLPLHRSYGLMRQTAALLWPPALAFLPQVFAGCCQPLLGAGPSRRYLYRSFPACLDLYSGCS